jgi:hypothetical protein
MNAGVRTGSSGLFTLQIERNDISPTALHSIRKACIGSTVAARLAGKSAAKVPNDKSITTGAVFNVPLNNALARVNPRKHGRCWTLGPLSHVVVGLEPCTDVVVYPGVDSLRLRTLAIHQKVIETVAPLEPQLCVPRD